MRNINLRKTLWLLDKIIPTYQIEKIVYDANINSRNMEDAIEQIVNSLKSTSIENKIALIRLLRIMIKKSTLSPRPYIRNHYTMIRQLKKSTVQPENVHLIKQIKLEIDKLIDLMYTDSTNIPSVPVAGIKNPHYEYSNNLIKSNLDQESSYKGNLNTFIKPSWIDNVPNFPTIDQKSCNNIQFEKSCDKKIQNFVYQDSISHTSDEEKKRKNMLLFDGIINTQQIDDKNILSTNNKYTHNLLDIQPGYTGDNNIEQQTENNSQMNESSNIDLLDISNSNNHKPTNDIDIFGDMNHDQYFVHNTTKSANSIEKLEQENDLLSNLDVCNSIKQIDSLETIEQESDLLLSLDQDNSSTLNIKSNKPVFMNDYQY